MSIEYKVTVQGLDELRRKLGQYPEEVFAEMVPAMRESTDYVSKAIVTEMHQPVARGISGVPGIPVYTQNLQETILASPTVKTRGADLRSLYGEVNADGVPYAIYVERGRGPGMPPIDALRDWVRVKIGDMAALWPIAKSIAKRGYKPYFMFARGWKKAHPWVSARFRKALKNVVRRLASGR